MMDFVNITNITNQLDIKISNINENVDTMFLVFNSIIVSLMQPGFACLEAGCVNSKNVTNIIMKNMLDMFLCGIIYWLVGYSLAYSPGNLFLGHSQWAGVGVDEARMAHWFFQFVFAATAATILSGAVAERCNFAAYIVYSVVISGFVYPIVAHWAWAEGGLLQLLGYSDFAGSGVVHSMAGVCSFVAALFIGPRLGRFQDGRPVDKPGHSTALVGLGGLLLISGFLAFNGGSLGHISEPGDGAVVARSITNTIMGGSGAAVLALVLCKSGLTGAPTWAFSFTLNATIAGMVSVCAGVDKFQTGGALASGAVACLIYLLLRKIVLALKVDDPLDAVAVHFGGGSWGVISYPLWAKGGIVYGANEESVALLWKNLVGLLLIIVWSAVCSIVLFGALKLIGLLRVSKEKEMEGLDISMHNEPAYPPQGWTETHSVQVPSPNHYNIPKTGNYFLTPPVSFTVERPSMAFDNMAMEMDNRQRIR